MAYTQTVIDDFGTASLDTAKWTTPDGASGVTAGGTNLSLAAVSTYPEITMISRTYDLTAGILAVKLSSTGSSTASVQWFFGVVDASGNEVEIQADPSSATWSFVVFGAATASSTVKVISTFWSTWSSGDFVGIGMSGSTLTVSKSSDGQTWNEIGHCTVGGTFASIAVGIDCTAGIFSGSSTWKAVLDDASYFTPSSTTQGTASVTGAGSVSADGVIVGAAAVTGAGTVSAAATQRSGATVSGAGSTTAVVTLRPTATVTGTGTTGANPGGTVTGTASVTGAGTVSAVVTVRPAASVTGQGTTTASVAQRSSSTIAGTGSVSAAATTRSTASVSGAGSVTAVVRQLGTASVLGSGSVSAQVASVVYGTASVMGVGSVVANPAGRTTPRPSAGTTARPSGGITLRPSAGVTPRP